MERFQRKADDKAWRKMIATARRKGALITEFYIPKAKQQTNLFMEDQVK